MTASALKASEFESGDFLALIRADLLEDKAAQLEKGFGLSGEAEQMTGTEAPKDCQDVFAGSVSKSVKFLRGEAERLRQSCKSH